MSKGPDHEAAERTARMILRPRTHAYSPDEVNLARSYRDAQTRANRAEIWRKKVGGTHDSLCDLLARVEQAERAVAVLMDALDHICSTTSSVEMTELCGEINCAAQRAVTEVHCTSLNLGWGECGARPSLDELIKNGKKARYE